MSIIEEDDLRALVVNGAEEIYKKGLVQAGEGNVSMRIPYKDELFITPTFNTYTTLEKEDIVRLKFDGTVLGKKRNPSSEYRLHVAVYQKRPKVNVVIHTHIPYAIILSTARVKIPVLIEEQVIFLGGYVEISHFASAHTEQFSKNVVNALGSRNGVLMANHGSLVCGRNMIHAIKIAELVEKLAWVYYGATLMGGAYSISEKSCPMFIDEFKDKFATVEDIDLTCEE